jgi:hypothetical protein
VTLTGAAGYVLRSSAPGIAAGEFIWRELGLENRFIWMPNWRATLDGGALVPEIAAPVQIEMQRWCNRVRRPVWLNADTPGAVFLDAGYVKTRFALKPADIANAIWPEALTGRGLDDSKFAYQPDDAGRHSAVRDALDEAFLIAASVFQAPGYLFEPLSNRGHFHRPETAGRAARDVIIWSSPSKLSENQFQKLQEAALNGRYQRSVVVVARGAGGTAISFRRITPDATTDYSSGPPPADGGDIAEPSSAPVFWMPSGELHTLLAHEDWTRLPESQRLTNIGLAVEELLNRMAA